AGRVLQRTCGKGDVREGRQCDRRTIVRHRERGCPARRDRVRVRRCHEAGAQGPLGRPSAAARAADGTRRGVGVPPVEGVGMMPCLRGGSFRVIVSLLALPRWLVVGCGVVSLLLGGGPRADAQNPRSHLLIITGAPGEPRFAEKFSASARAIRQAAGLPAGQAQVLSGSTSMSDADGRATRDNMLAAIRSIAESSSRGDQVTIVLIGHGSGGEGNSFNLTGPDIGAAELASALNSLAGRQLTIVVAASAAGGWVPALAAPGRVVIA